ncbi:Forkhead box N2 [Octopus vulgaris]|uniref:Forkhead box N2 n=3 Tax=Octopus TaxID=6643 RepID=A0AA36BB86_OCTVU|nr:uncharacterized protein LOC106869721 [Octopus bimaculoides]XP_036362897.1 uncharacterized protein LOC118765264 [Octopus sinensis]CAI9730482.1 Forkhead box N2 [Octopus vulgaris]|eukprot:XP_014771053.1 PREDICTED: uncharacterized protein LOC106869721 [Octopus bimaculoides]
MNNFNYQSGKRNSQNAGVRRRGRKQLHEIQNNFNDDIQILEVSLPKRGPVKERPIEKIDLGVKENYSPPTKAIDQCSSEVPQVNYQRDDKLEISFLEGDRAEKSLDLGWESQEIKRNILLKLATDDDYSFTKTEECFIHERAKLYVVNMFPEKHYYYIPDNAEEQPQSIDSDEEILNEGQVFFPTSYSGKRKRRSYNNFNCYVTHHKNDDLYDNSHILPKGTRLLKPPNKLVELVAQAIDGSPDGLLQVHQIYTVLQNKYPYFRFMDRMAINSWRSSIRHALYQKWFRKIHFSTESINRKGCYWTINRQFSPKTWTMPGFQNISSVYFTTDSTENCTSNFQPETQLPEVEAPGPNNSITYEQCNSSNEFQPVINMPQEYSIAIRDDQQNEDEITTLIKDPDPILIPWSSESVTSVGHIENAALLSKDSQMSQLPISFQMNTVIDCEEMLNASPDTWLQQCSGSSDWPQNVDDASLCYPYTQQILLATFPLATSLANT